MALALHILHIVHVTFVSNDQILQIFTIIPKFSIEGICNVL